MTVVSTKEFNTNQEMYFDMALNEQIFIQRGDYTFIVTKANEPKRQHKKPDEKLRNAITMDEFRIRVKEDLREIFKRGRNEGFNNS